jgi:hypothetical protein
MRNKIHIIFVVFFLAQLLCFAQSDSRGKRVENLKKMVPELWYVDQKPALDTAKKDTVDIKSETYSGRETVFEPQNLENFFKFLQYLFFAVLAGAILYLVVKSKFSFGGFSNSNHKVNEEITESTKIERIEDLESVNFQTQIEKAEAAQNYRLAIRVYYLWLIKNLSDAKFIDFQSNKTNRQYCNEMSGSKYSMDFEECTKYYNFVWFGKFGVSSDDYQKIIAHYKKLIGRFL